MAHTLDRRPRKPAHGKTASANYPSLHHATLRLPQETKDGQPTFAHVYRKLWPQLREIRKLAYSTAKQYDSVMARQILPLCDQKKAFADLDEDDFITTWDLMCCKDLSKSSLQIASIMIRTLMDLAYEQGLTQTTLWGLPQFRLLPDDGTLMKITPCTDPQEEGQRLADLTVRTPRSISLAVEFALAKGMIDNCYYHGELIAGLIMLCLGCRTSEATGFSYKHLTMVCQDYPALVRFEVSRKDSRVTQAGGKTNNAFRLLPVPRFLYHILLSRRKSLEARYSPEEIEQMPLACKGMDYTCRCTQRELNETLKGLYRQAGVAEDLMHTAYQDMRDHPDLAEECEGRATAYLLRHQFCTAMEFCGLSPGEIYNVMGHTNESTSVYKSDFSNPDVFRILADKMSRRPLTQMLDQLPACRTYWCQDTPITVRTDGDTILFFPTEGLFDISFISAEQGDNLQLEPECVTILHQDFSTVPWNGEETLSIRNALHTLGEQAWLAAVDKTVVLPSPAAVIEHLGDTGTPFQPEIHVIHAPASNTPTTPIPHIPESVSTPSSPSLLETPEQTTPKQKEPADVPPSDQPSAPVRSGKPAPKVFGTASASGILYILDNKGLIHRLPEQQPVRNRARAGSWLLEQQHPTPASLLCYRPSEPALILTPDGMLFFLAPGQHLDCPDVYKEGHPAYDALRSGGILLQGPALDLPDGTITCLSGRGNIRRISLARFRRIPPDGRPLIAVSAADPLVAACLSSKDADLLLATAKGKVLRISSDDLRPVTTPGSALYEGMALDETDRAVLCQPYAPDTEYLFVSRFGRAVRLSKAVTIMPHKRKSQGAQRVLLHAGDQLAALLPAAPTLFVVADNGKGLCIRTDSISATVSAAQGVEVMALKPSNGVINAIGMNWCHTSSTE